jgi:hypothetical protein
MLLVIRRWLSVVQIDQHVGQVGAQLRLCVIDLLLGLANRLLLGLLLLLRLLGGGLLIEILLLSFDRGPAGVRGGVIVGVLALFNAEAALGEVFLLVFVFLLQLFLAVVVVVLLLVVVVFLLRVALFFVQLICCESLGAHMVHVHGVLGIVALFLLLDQLVHGHHFLVVAITEKNNEIF